MYFLAKDEANLLAAKLRRQIEGRPRAKLVLYYDSGNRDYPRAAKAIAASVGDFAEAHLLFLFGVTADGWDEGAANEMWAPYYRWRRANGEDRRLYDAPGHRFEPHEAEHLSEAIEFALRLGWDALVAAGPGRQLLFLSHDDRMEIHRGFKWRSLAEKLLGLGYWHRPGKSPIVPAAR